MRKAVLIVLAMLAIRLLPKALRREAKTLQLVTLMFQLMAASGAPNTSKTYNVEQRTGDLETRVGNLEQGIFPNVSGGSTIVLDTQQGSVTLHCGALSSFTSGPQTTFLATLSQCANPGGDLTQDPSSGSTWATGERGYINNTIIRLNNVLNSFQNHNFMAS